MNSGNEYRDLVRRQIETEAGPDTVVRSEISIATAKGGVYRAALFLSSLRPRQIVGKFYFGEKGAVISCKYQGTAGTAEQKIPAELLELTGLTKEGYRCLLIYGGEGFTQEKLEEYEQHARDWGIAMWRWDPPRESLPSDDQLPLAGFRS